MSDARGGSPIVLLACGVLVVTVLVLLTLPRVRSGASPGRVQCMNNLKQIELALHWYLEEHGSFPPAYVADDTGRALHSWRVLILPYLEEAELFERYRFDEPWDGPNNSQLGSLIPAAYRCPVDDEAGSGSFSTSYVAIMGPHTMWPEADGRKLTDIEDDLGGTLHVAEIADSGIHWMEPRDLKVDELPPTVNAPEGHGISSRHTKVAQAAFADGHVQSLSDDLSPDLVRKIIAIDDGGPGEDEPF